MRTLFILSAEGFCAFCRREIGTGHAQGCPYHVPRRWLLSLAVVALLLCGTEARAQCSGGSCSAGRGVRGVIVRAAPVYAAPAVIVQQQSTVTETRVSVAAYATTREPVRVRRVVFRRR